MQFKLFNHKIEIGFDDNFHTKLILPKIVYTGENHPDYDILGDEHKNKLGIYSCKDLCTWEWKYLLKPRIIIKN